MLFLWINLVKIFIFLMGFFFSKFLDGIEEKAPKHQTKENVHNFKHLWTYEHMPQVPKSHVLVQMFYTSDQKNRADLLNFILFFPSKFYMFRGQYQGRIQDFWKGVHVYKWMGVRFADFISFLFIFCYYYILNIQ